MASSIPTTVASARYSNGLNTYIDAPEVEPLHRASYCSRVFQRKCLEMAFLSLPLAQQDMPMNSCGMLLPLMTAMYVLGRLAQSRKMPKVVYRYANLCF